MDEIENELIDNTDETFEEFLDSEEELLSKIESNIDEEPDEVVEQEVQPEPEKPQITDDVLVKIKVNGVEQEVPLSELKNGYQRQADYTQKTQELSNERQKVEAERHQWNQYVSSIPVLANVAQQNLIQAEQTLLSQELADLAVNDPAAYVAETAKLQRVIAENKNSLLTMETHWNEYQNEVTQNTAKIISDEVAETQGYMTKKYGDEWTSGKLYNEGLEYAAKIGIPKETIDNVTNYRFIDTLIKAARYDKLTSKQNIAAKKVDSIPPKVTKVINDGDNSKSNDFAKRKSTAIKKMRQGDDNDFIDLLADLI